jgi:multiple sugar transport system substrate-binding protein
MARLHRNRWRRILTALSTTAVAATMATGCGGSDPGSDDGGVDNSSITLAALGPLQPQFQKYATAYEQKFPGRKVTVRTEPNDWPTFLQGLVTARLGGQVPDIITNVDFAVNQLATNRVTMNLAPWLESGKDGLKGSNFLPQFVGQYRPLNNPGQITGLPVSADSTALFYNKTLFQRYGITELPAPSWTWDDLYRVAAQIQQKSSGKVDGLASPLVTGDSPAVYNPVIQAYGGYVYDPKTNKTGIGEPAAVEAWTHLIKTYGLTSSAYSTNASSYPQFSAGQAAMAIGVRAQVPSFKALTDDWDVQTMPTIKGKTTVGGGSYGLSISDTSKNKNAAWAFLAWFYANDGGMVLAQESGQVVPPTVDGLSSEIWRAVKPPANEEAFAVSARTAVLQVQLPGKAQSVLSAAVVKAVQQVVLEKRPVKDAFTEAADTVNQALASAK